MIPRSICVASAGVRRGQLTTACLFVLHATSPALLLIATFDTIVGTTFFWLDVYFLLLFWNATWF